MKKFLISLLALFFVVATVHAQTDTTSKMKTTMHKSKSSTGTHKMAGHHKGMHHKSTTTQKSKTTTTGGTSQKTPKPVAANTTAPSTTTTTTKNSTAKITAKGTHTAVNSSGKKS